LKPNLRGDADDTAGRAGTSVSGLLGLGVVALAEVVGAAVDDDGAADDALGADELDELVRHAALGVTLTIGLNVTQVTDVAVLVFGGAVLLAVGVEVRASRCASVGVIAEGMDVHSTLSVGVVAGDVPCDGRRRGLIGLLEGDGALDVGVSSDDGD